MKMNRMLKKLLPLLAVLSGYTMLAQAGDFYKVVKADGSVEYTQKPPKKGAKAVDLPGLSVISPEKKLKQYNPESKTLAQSVDGSTDTTTSSAKYSGLEIASPADQENIWGTGGDVAVKVNLSGKLAKGDKLVIELDGSQQPGVSGTGTTISGVARGEHKLQAKIISRGGKELTSSSTITIFVMQSQQQQKRARGG